MPEFGGHSLLDGILFSLRNAREEVQPGSLLNFSDGGEKLSGLMAAGIFLRHYKCNGGNLARFCRPHYNFKTSGGYAELGFTVAIGGDNWLMASRGINRPANHPNVV